jgi:uncharacterized membrane protein
VLIIRRDDGQLTLLVIGYVAIIAVLIVIGIDVSKVFLARRALSSAADAAALAAAQAVDRDAIYQGSAGCGALLPLDPDTARLAVEAAVADDAPDLDGSFVALDQPDTTVEDGTVSVHLGGAVSVPFGHVLAALLPGHPDGTVRVDVRSAAESPLTVPGGC